MSAAIIVGLEALLLRAESAKAAFAGEAKTAATHQFWTGYAKGLRDLKSGAGDKLAARDALRSKAGCLGAGAVPGLAVSLEILAASDGTQGDGAELVKGATHGVADVQVDQVEKLENGIFATAFDNEHTALGVDSDNCSSCHERKCMAGKGGAR